jgi:hypothetical protein
MEYKTEDHLKHITALDGFDSKEVQRFLYWVRVDEFGCWMWAGYRDPRGYGKFTRSPQFGGKPIAAHRMSHEYFIGPIPKGFQVHHKCVKPGCCNPDHLEALSIADHVAKTVSHPSNQTHCLRGHEFTIENTRMYNGFRTCRACANLRGKWKYNPDYPVVGPSGNLYCVNDHPLFGDNMDLLTLPDGRHRRRCKACRNAAAERFKIDNTPAILAVKLLRRADTIAARKIQRRQEIRSLGQTARFLPATTLVSTLRGLLNDCD